MTPAALAGHAGRVAMLLALLLTGLPAVYSEDQPPAELEARFRGYIESVRCLVCQNQNIADSNAPLASDLRREVLEMMQAGESDDAITEFLVARYGDFVLYKPPFNTRTVVIWLMPVALAVLGGIVLFFLLTRARDKRAVALNDADQSRLQAILKED